ncbi:hypothetical protein [Streptomyces sp. NPDC057199]|uniref:hypothetical protein n=1 Tax=Streptomyces sp. NPDC057199 TaxID=3346047 RepID=UPI0036388D24
MTAGWGTRTVRAAVFAAVCVLLAALGHVMMSGSPVPWWTMAAGGVLTGGAGWCLAGRERGLPLIVSVVIVAQGLLHAGFSLAQSGSAGRDMDSTPMASAHMGSVPMGSIHTDSADAMDMGHMGSGPMAHPAHDMDGMSSLGMLIAHLLAALLCGLWLAYGERAAFRILRAVAGRLAAPLRLLLALPVPPHRPRVRVPRRSPDRSLRRLLLVHAITSRGPPVGTAVA